MLVNFKPRVVAMIIAGLSVSPLMAATDTDTALQSTIDRLEKEVASIKQEVNAKHKMTAKTEIKEESRAGAKNLFVPFDPDLPGKALVATGPYVGIDISFAGSNLIVNSPSVNTDVQLLGIRKKIVDDLHNTFGMMMPKLNHSHLLFSGVVESQANYTKMGGGPSSSDIDVTNVSIDATVFGPTDWILGFVELSYDNSTPIGSVFTSASNYRIYNSRVYVNKAFVTIGNLNSSPLYTTFGQFYVPFGRYSSFMVSDPLTKLIARTKERAILVGIQPQADNTLYTAVYAFKGDSHRGSNGNINNGGVNLGYRFDTGFLSGDLGVGVIGNLADSGGMQVGTNFQTFERIKHRVPAYDARAVVSVGEHIDLIGEYITASTEFNPADMSYNNHGAKPSAFDLEASYSFSVFNDKPSSIGIGYGKTKESAAAFVPLTRTYVTFNTSLMRQTLQSIEFRHDQEYAVSDTFSGAGGTVLPPQSGKADNAVTAQFDFYF